MSEKANIIESIKVIIEQHGMFTTADLEATSSPIVNSISKDNHQLAERFYSNHASVSTYVHEQVVDTEDMDYVSLPEDTLEDILLLAQEWEAICIKTEKRCKD